jgi:WD40 repeat protein
MCYQTDGPLLASGCAEGKIAIWKPEKRSLPDVTADMGAPITDLAWCAGMRHLAAATEDGRVAAFQAATSA